MAVFIKILLTDTLLQSNMKFNVGKFYLNIIFISYVIKPYNIYISLCSARLNALRKLCG